MPYPQKEYIMLNINYPVKFGPENNIELDISNSFMVEIPPLYSGDISTTLDDHWEQCICLYSMSSGAKVYESGNFSRKTYHGGWYMVNYSQKPLSYLITHWHKRNPPDSSTPWYQTGKILTKYQKIKIAEDNPRYKVDIIFNGLGDLVNKKELSHIVEFQIMSTVRK